MYFLNINLFIFTYFKTFNSLYFIFKLFKMKLHKILYRFKGCLSWEECIVQPLLEKFPASATITLDWYYWHPWVYHSHCWTSFHHWWLRLEEQYEKILSQKHGIHYVTWWYTTLYNSSSIKLQIFFILDLL